MSDVNIRHLDLLLKQYELHQSYSVSLDELESVLCTSRRNVSIVMKKLAKLGWIEWVPAIGRSNASSLKVTTSLHQALTEFLISELGKGRLSLVGKLIEMYGKVAIRALSVATEITSHENESTNSVLISSYPWVDTVDPTKTFRHTELHVAKSIYDVLLKQDSKGNLKPSLAHDWSVEGRTVHLWLRPEVYRHDGELLQTQDVAWSLKRLMEIDGPVKELWSCVDSIEIISPECIEITLHYTNYLFPYMLAMPNASIVCRDKRFFRGGTCYHIGTGPFKIEDWCNESIKLTAHKEYFSTRALLEKLTLSYSEFSGLNSLSFNLESETVEEQRISAISYLTYKRRHNSEISTEQWATLAGYIDEQKKLFDLPRAVDNVCLKQASPCLKVQEIPILTGKVVLAEPVWTIPILARNAEWLHEVIRSTGLELEVVTVPNISEPQSVSDTADLLLIEDVIEMPIDYGVYEWLCIATGLRFGFNTVQMKKHHASIRRAVGSRFPFGELMKIEQSLRSDYVYLPLFSGGETVVRTEQVRGVQVRNTGYSDFYRLWIGR
ncbi:ABC transporter substrate-binding protein [Vibrio europaeus]|uniref:ABC transporter substrate-binding protein n=1 Tax=Vibrio europaeus TaxID=300876 RepID=UPI00148C3172|nr:ABC transporter substrate-binding protein [Vibrio europaeus]MDC5818458.1 ABC transporter substrate-binding protein [Vibrio europaeus]MDC5839335.1 ABC transporter substrate-binding protein [Vibrio europaeus]MDC5857099.1 ABC transporter substrate-binding protein [Vibrio europaeus]MDC5871519.1 ABC transporter substrate-binding protein [Vibrio europaeus]NOH22097.1 transporter [Vibrio europaeus]